MPRLNGTGPRGFGPMTGRGFGSCPRGFGYGPGFGQFGRRRTFSKIEEKEILTEELKELEEEAKAIKERLKEIN
ncbi:MAG: DUF5320 domain-containing protein [archaeon]